jgi:exopolysaccharide biosynthesis polyprenyl glycosylphosphotransferase
MEETIQEYQSSFVNKMPRKLQWVVFSILVVFSDFLMIGLAFLLAHFIRFRLPVQIFDENSFYNFEYYQRLTFLLIFVWLLFFALGGAYQRRNLLGGIKEYSIIFRSSTISILVIIIATFLEPKIIIARGWLLLVWPLTFFFAALGRFISRRIVYRLRQLGYFMTPAIIVGGNEEGVRLAEQLFGQKTSGIQIVGFVDEKVPPGTVIYRDLRSLGYVSQLEEIIPQYDIGEIILATSAISSRNKQLEIFRNYGISSDVNVRLSSGLYEIITTGITISEFAYIPFVTINKARLTGWDEGAKMLLDYALTFPGVIALLPVYLVIALLVKITSPGPIIHRRRVMGMNGKQFDAYKFRTMYVNGDEILNAHPELKEALARDHKLKDDPRITPVGRFLRKYSLDELPQLFNVIKREMSLVGPRMISPEEVKNYTKWDINLMTVHPGISGLWQVSGRSDVSYEDRVRLDMYYIRNWTIWLDLQILLQTIPAVLKGRGAY